MRTKDYENVIADLDERIAELEAENAKLEAEKQKAQELLLDTMVTGRDRIEELEAKNQRLREALHQIYGEACFILNSEDDVDAWGFVKSTRDTALQEGK